MRSVVVAGFAVWLALPAGQALGQPRPFNVRDLVAMDRLSEPAVLPDGSRVVFTQSVLDLAANRRRTDLWIVGADGSGLRQLTTHQASDTSATWSHDGKAVWFLSSRSGASQVWRVPADGGEPVQVTQLPLDVGAYKVSPDGSRLAVALEVFVDCPTLACTTDRLEAKEKRQESGQLYDRLFVRHWDTWSDGEVPANALTGDAVAPVAKIPEYKVSAVRVQKV